MPSGEYEKEERYCAICKKKLRPLYKNKDWDSRKYHVTCFRDLLADIKNFDTVAYTKYKYKKKVNGIPIEDIPPDHKFVLDFS
tara:strand:+ start:1567 stop:1815 length:249 start_codon:yes stop_codon:yes gene_type:complete